MESLDPQWFNASEKRFCCYCQRACSMRSKCRDACFEIPSHHSELFANAVKHSVRLTTRVGVEDLLNLMKSILSPSKVLLRSANVLLPFLVRHQASAEISRVETDRTLMEIGAKHSRQDLDALLEPCSMVNPLQKSTPCTLQAEEHSKSSALGLSRSPLRRIHVSASRPIDWKHLTRLGTPKAVLSLSKSPAQRGIPTTKSNLSSPARFFTPNSV